MFKSPQSLSLTTLISLDSELTCFYRPASCQFKWGNNLNLDCKRWKVCWNPTWIMEWWKKQYENLQTAKCCIRKYTWECSHWNSDCAFWSTYIYLILVCKYRSIQTCISTSLLQSSVICTKSESKRSQMHETITKHILLKCTVQLGVSFGFIKDKNEPSRSWCTFLFIPASLYSAPLSCWCQTVSRVYRLLCYIFVHILGQFSL